jgi:hypothetical protein
VFKVNTKWLKKWWLVLLVLVLWAIPSNVQEGNVQKNQIELQENKL